MFKKFCYPKIDIRIDFNEKFASKYKLSYINGKVDLFQTLASYSKIYDFYQKIMLWLITLGHLSTITLIIVLIKRFDKNRLNQRNNQELVRSN